MIKSYHSQKAQRSRLIEILKRLIKNYRFKKLWSASKFLYLEKQPKIFIKCCQILRLTLKNALMVKAIKR
ncbi:hypothetical protein HPHPH42_1069 [Helicobacter pylori Hp H-42]|uniref:Uncharacterized protein n=1 Tax=Helicobacter pylori Hp H-42 TaxID=992047 RepID=A0AB33XH19_HELPX|nr:hypothetical protein HPHPH42_1069 [Helicobacter pylori Hp H-42]